MSKVGRPPIYNDPEEMAKDIEAYFEQASSPYTVEGLATALDMTTETLRRYQQKEEFCATVEKAKQRIVDDLNRGAITKEFSATMVKFNLTNNFDWSDTKRQELTGANGNPIKTENEVSFDEGQAEAFLNAVTANRERTGDSQEGSK